MISSARQRLILAGLISAIVVAVMVTVWRLNPSPPALQKRPFKALGEMAAAETGELAGPNGRIVVWRIANAPADLPTVHLVATTFDRHLARQSGLQVVAQLSDPVDIETMRSLPSMSAPTADRFLEILTEHRDADVLVLIGSSPRLAAAELQRLPSRRPKVLAVSLLSPVDPALLKQGVLNAALVPRGPAGDNLPGSASVAEVFNHYYRIMTADNPDTNSSTAAR